MFHHLALTAATILSCHSNGVLSDPRCQPGAIDPTKTAAVLCAAGYTTKSVRPPASYTTQLKIQQIKQYGFTDTNTKDYEEDHLISLELGGDPKASANLWPEAASVPWKGQTIGFHEKDKVENYLHKLVCQGTLRLQDAQKIIASNWLSYWPLPQSKLALPMSENISSSSIGN